MKSLGTRDHHVAVARRYAALAEFQRIFDGVCGADASLETALNWRQTFAALERGDISRFEVWMPEGKVSDPDELGQ